MRESGGGAARIVAAVEGEPVTLATGPAAAEWPWTTPYGPGAVGLLGRKRRTTAERPPRRVTL